MKPDIVDSMLLSNCQTKILKKFHADNISIFCQCALNDSNCHHQYAKERKKRTHFHVYQSALLSSFFLRSSSEL